MERREKISVQRWILFAIGMYLFGAGLALTIKAAMGVTPMSGVTTILNKIFPAISLGTFSFIINTSFFGLEFIFDPKNFNARKFLQIIPVFLTSVFIDLNMWIFSFVNPQTYVMNVVVLILGCAVMGVCFALLVKADVVLMPIEAFISILADRYNKSWGTCKIWIDVGMVVAAVAISLAVYQRIFEIREGTIISAVLVGKFTHWTQMLMEKNAKPEVQEEVVAVAPELSE